MLVCCCSLLLQANLFLSLHFFISLQIWPLKGFSVTCTKMYIPMVEYLYCHKYCTSGSLYRALKPVCLSPHSVQVAGGLTCNFFDPSLCQQKMNILFCVSRCLLLSQHSMFQSLLTFFFKMSMCKTIIQHPIRTQIHLSRLLLHNRFWKSSMIQPCALTDNKGKEGAYGTMSLSLHSCHKRYGSLLGQYYEL